jgi:DNA polymerase III subunit epsilon
VILRGRRHGAAAAYTRAGRPRQSTPWRDARWCAVDLELTGLDPRKDDIIAIGAVPIERGRVMLGQAFYTLVRTVKRSGHGAILVHRLRVDDLADAPPLDEAIELLLGLLAGSVPVFHTAAVERTFLGRLLVRRGVRLPPAADTEILGQEWMRARDGSAPPRLTLVRLASALHQRAEAPHHALGDALTTATAFIALASRLDAIEPQTVGSLVRAGERAAAARRLGPGR